MNPIVKNFFLQHGVTVDEDGYALSEMLQFIWRSAIRNGEEIWVYIPSIRMRNLLKQWIEENSPKLLKQTENNNYRATHPVKTRMKRRDLHNGNDK